MGSPATASSTQHVLTRQSGSARPPCPVSPRARVLTSHALAQDTLPSIPVAPSRSDVCRCAPPDSSDPIPASSRGRGSHGATASLRLALVRPSHPVTARGNAAPRHPCTHTVPTAAARSRPKTSCRKPPAAAPQRSCAPPAPSPSPAGREFSIECVSRGKGRGRNKHQRSTHVFKLSFFRCFFILKTFDFTFTSEPPTPEVPTPTLKINNQQNNFLGPADDTVTAPLCSTSTSTHTLGSPYSQHGIR